MTISSREKEVPTDLRAACLYLDDIEEIRQIILDAAAARGSLSIEGSPAAHEIETGFYIADKVCTEIQDLPKIGRRTRDFEMRLSAQDGFKARFAVSLFLTQWTTDGLTKADTWRAFHKIETVFERRKILWKRLFPRRLESRKNLFFSFILLMLPVSYSIGRLRYHLTSGLDVLLYAPATVGLLVASGYHYFRQSTVV